MRKKCLAVLLLILVSFISSCKNVDNKNITVKPAKKITGDTIDYWTVKWF